MTQLRLAVVGAGAIGRKHIELVVADGAASLAAIVDPGDAGRELAASLATPWFASLEAMLDAIKPDGVILATPNHLHVSGALAAIARAVPLLVEKPVATRSKTRGASRTPPPRRTCPCSSAIIAATTRSFARRAIAWRAAGSAG